MALALAFPLHGHIGMNYVLSDYVPKFFGKAVLGLTKLNLEGPGITGTLKALWKG